MKNKKPCEECGHTKSKHRKNSCNQVWQVRGQTFIGLGSPRGVHAPDTSSRKELDDEWLSNCNFEV